MLGQRRRRWLNIETILGECLVFAGNKLDAVFAPEDTRVMLHIQGVYQCARSFVVILLA